jgi:serine phosphatase RsbU (regulator of sigma subunit)
MLGVAAEPDLVAADLVLRPGDLLLLYTDGVLDARSGRETFGERRLREALGACAGQASSVVLATIDEAVRAFAPGRARDDKALMALKVPE